MALADQIQEVAARYPDRRSAMLPALRMAQERYGWLSPEALAWATRVFGTVYELYGMTEMGATIGNTPFFPVRPGSMGIRRATPVVEQNQSAP